jgi:N-acetylglutamate synthase-like GNAT family acetyltransferase
MNTTATDEPSDRAVVRGYREGDYISLMQIYRDGRIAGDIEHHEIELDLDTAEDTYLGRSQDHLWLAESEGKAIGMISVLGMGEAIAQIRWLRVDPAWQQTDLACRLLQTAVDHCRLHRFLKIVIMTSVRAERAVPMLACLGFQYSREVKVDNHVMHEFYLDLYSDEDRGNCLPTVAGGNADQQSENGCSV